MQSLDNKDQIIQSLPVDLDNLKDLRSKIKTAEEKGASSHIIGKLLKAGEEVTIYNLKFKVEFADYVKGKFTVKLILK